MAEDMTDRYGRRSGRRIDSARDRALPGSAGPTAHDPRSRRRTGRRVPGARDSLRCSLPCATPACPAGRSRAIRTPIRRATTSSRTPPTTPARHKFGSIEPNLAQQVAKKSPKSRFRGIFGRGGLTPPPSLATRERARARCRRRRLRGRRGAAGRSACRRAHPATRGARSRRGGGPRRRRSRTAPRPQL
jgi:hypothetical protein